ncbi:MoaD/ThiS family protein [Thermodesulfobacteriota bacterium]
MFVSISFLGLQRRLVNTENLKIRLSEQVERVSDLFGYLNDQYPELSLNRENVLVTVNSVESSLDHKLRANDEILFMPHIGGG